MKIIGYTFSCLRDIYLCQLLIHTRNKYVTGNHYIFVDFEDIEVFEKTFADYSNVIIKGKPRAYYNGAGWAACLMKLDAIYAISELEKDFDYLIYCDSDVFFLNGKIFNELMPVDMQGLKHDVLYQTALGPWSHFSGGCHFTSFAMVEKIAGITIDDIDQIRSDFRKFNLTENEDIFLSYLNSYFKGSWHAHTSKLMYCGDIENEVQKGESEYCIVHLNQMWESFLSESVTGKWDVPKIIFKKNLPCVRK